MQEQCKESLVDNISRSIDSAICAYSVCYSNSHLTIIVTRLLNAISLSCTREDALVAYWVDESVIVAAVMLLVTKASKANKQHEMRSPLRRVDYKLHVIIGAAVVLC